MTTFCQAISLSTFLTPFYFLLLKKWFCLFVLVAPHGNPCPMQWKCGTFTTRPPGKSHLTFPFSPWFSRGEEVLKLPWKLPWYIFTFNPLSPSFPFLVSKLLLYMIGNIGVHQCRKQLALERIRKDNGKKTQPPVFPITSRCFHLF